MAKNFAKEIYAVNKYSEGIVYPGAKFDYELTLEDFLREEPNMTQADFEYWKNISDEIYKEEDLLTTNTTRKNISIHEIEETNLVSVPSAESEFFKSKDANKITREDIVNPRFIYSIAKKELTEIQYIRFLKYYSQAKTLDEIAEEEGVNHTSILRSITSSEKKIKKILKNICTKHSIFDVMWGDIF